MSERLTYSILLCVMMVIPVKLRLILTEVLLCECWNDQAQTCQLP